jgi:Concanavalin A-like lectin/glucanases superfamily
MSLTTSMVSYWQLEEASGTRVDSFGSNNLTDHNGTGQAAGIIGNAASFTAASTQYLSKTSNSSLQLGGTDFTIMAWVRITDKSTTRAFLSKWNLDISSVEYILEYDQSVDQFLFATSPNGSSGDVLLHAATFGSPSVNTWYQIFAWFDSVGGNMFISVNNGSADTAAQSLVFTGTADLQLSAQFFSGSQVQLWQGQIDEVSIWKRVLTSAERTQLWNGGQGLSFNAIVNGQMPAEPRIQGPPMRGAPWAQRLFVNHYDYLQGAAPTPPAPQASNASGSLFTAPPVPGAPWNKPRITPQMGQAVGAAPPPPAAQAMSESHVVTGPPIPGAPWNAARHFLAGTGPLSPAGATPPAPTTVRGLPFLERVPDISGPSGLDRFRRFTELLSICFNSLVRKGELVQTGQADFDIFAKGIAATGSGATGTFFSGPFGSGTGIPGPGLSGTFNMGVFP